MPAFSRIASAALFAALVATSSTAWADASSWAAVGSGPAWLRQGSQGDWDLRWTMPMEVGMGTAPQRSWTIGGLARVQPYFGLGTDLAAAFRTTAFGFHRGTWGLAFDIGPYYRLSRDSLGAAGTLTFGAPWGFQLAAQASHGSNDWRSGSLWLGFDFARLTAHRTVGENWWPNPAAHLNDPPAALP